jgi:hypothetical protein
MRITYDHKKFSREMNNLVKYSIGYLDGVQAGKQKFFYGLGLEIKEILQQYIDSNARVNPESLHHVYEWYQNGSPNARLFDIQYTVSNLGLSIKSTFSQSQSVKQGSNTPFYDKARVMELGIPVTIAPVRSDVLVFEDEFGETVFTKNPVTVKNPGGNTQGQFEKVFDGFFNIYFTQAFMRSSGIAQYLENPVLYKRNITKGKNGGRGVGFTTGYRWIINAGMMA